MFFDPAVVDIDLDQFVNVGHVQRPPVQREALWRVEAGDPFFLEQAAIRRDDGEVAVAVLVGGAAVDVGDIEMIERGVVNHGFRVCKTFELPEQFRRFAGGREGAAAEQQQGGKIETRAVFCVHCGVLLCGFSPVATAPGGSFIIKE